jgi:hypothetical protein
MYAVCRVQWGLCSIRSVRYLVSLLYGSLHIENMMNINIIIQSEWRPRGLCMEMILILRIGGSLSLTLSPTSVSFSNPFTSICLFLLSFISLCLYLLSLISICTLSLVLHLHLSLSLILYLNLSLSLVLYLHTSFSFSCYLPITVSFYCPLSPSVYSLVLYLHLSLSLILFLRLSFFLSSISIYLLYSLSPCVSLSYPLSPTYVSPHLYNTAKQRLSLFLSGIIRAPK